MNYIELNHNHHNQSYLIYTYFSDSIEIQQIIKMFLIHRYNIYMYIGYQKYLCKYINI